jgi:glycosyltransferase involved in cell wall biosynthesis
VGRMMGNKLIVCIDELKKMFPNSTLIYNRVDPKFFKSNKKVNKIKNSVGFSGWKTEEYHCNEIEKAINEAGKKMVIAENIPKEKMPEFYQKLESFINLPPECSGFALKYLEAMASGVPRIIGSQYGGGNSIPVTKIEDYKTLKEAILMAKKKDYRKWIIKNKFTWEDATAQLEKIFKKSI